jgi:hypothetical protein
MISSETDILKAELTALFAETDDVGGVEKNRINASLHSYHDAVGFEGRPWVANASRGPRKVEAVLSSSTRNAE